MPSDTRPRWTPLLVFTAAILTAWTLRATVLYTIDDALTPETRRVYGGLVKFLLMALPPVLYLALVDRRRPADALDCRLPPTPKAWQAAALWTGIALVLGTGGALLSDGSLAALPAHGIAGLVAILMATALSPICEEILFRGFFLNQYAQRTAWWKANLIQAVLFSLVHAPYWIANRGFTGDVVHDLLAVALFGWLMGFALRHSRSLYICIVAHILYNAIQGALQMPAIA